MDTTNTGLISTISTAMEIHKNEHVQQPHVTDLSRNATSSMPLNPLITPQMDTAHMYTNNQDDTTSDHNTTVIARAGIKTVWGVRNTKER